MDNAPKRIWTNFKEANRLDVAYDEPPIKPTDDCDQEYVRADIHASEIARLRAALAEAEARNEGAVMVIATLTGERDTARDLAAKHAALLDKAVEALGRIDALDPEHHIGGFGENALRGLVLRMGETARATLKEITDAR